MLLLESLLSFVSVLLTFSMNEQVSVAFTKEIRHYSVAVTIMRTELRTDVSQLLDISEPWFL